MNNIGTFGRCPSCREWDFIGGTVMGHVCKPRFECRMEWEANDPDAWMTVHAADAESAAERGAEKYDCGGGEYAIVSGRNGNTVIHVRKPGEDTFERYAIEAETVPQYHARRADS